MSNKNYKNNSFLKKNKYKEGFFTKVKNEEISIGINEDIIKKISKKRKEPLWMLKFRLSAYNHWTKMKEPHWLKAKYDKLDYNNYIYYSAPCNKKNSKNILKKKKYLTKPVQDTFNKLGIPTNEDSNIAVDAIFDSVSVSTTHQKELLEKGIIFCSFSEAIKKYPKLVKKYLGSVVPINDNFFASLNSSVASDGTFIYVGKNVHCPIELSTYFRINSPNTGQFERTIIIADENSYLSYIEGCSAPKHNKHQLHAAVVEVILLKNSRVKYSTVQNWFSGENFNEGILNFVTKRALCYGKNSKMSWTQSETGAAITWKYPSVILKGDNTIGEFFSIALTNHYQQADTGTKMIHIGKNTKSTIISKGISSGNSDNTYRGLVKITKNATNARNYTQCSSMIIGDKCGAHTFPYLKVYNKNSVVEHEATTSKIGQDQIFFCKQRGINEDNAISMIVNGFCKDILSKLPLEFAVEATNLLEINLKNSIG